jgi:parallel beta-helix repeat protein
MVARTLAIVILILTLTLISDTRSTAATAVELVYIVDSDQDDPDTLPGDFICKTSKNTCTFRAAVQEANNDGIPSRIKFASKMTISPGPFQNPQGLGYGIGEDYTVIDASDQWDGNWPEGEPGVTFIENRYHLGLLRIQGDYAKVFGIEFTGGGNRGILVDGSKGTIIGGVGPGQRNVFSLWQDTLFDTWGVEITGVSSKIDVRGNFFGTKDGQSAFLTPGEYGIVLTNGDNFIRDNLIVGQTEAGIYSWQYGHNLFMNNTIGVDVDGKDAIPNKVGILLQHGSDDNQIGPGNDISKNTQEGILIDGGDQNRVMGNSIRANGNHGISIEGSIDNQIGVFEGNAILRNGGHGINIYHGSNNQVFSNTICSSSEAGIYLKNSQSNTIGGPLKDQDNWISNNATNGIQLDSGANSNTVAGNFIGLGPTGCDVGNRKNGVLIANGASDNRIGGVEPGKGNWVGYNDEDGIMITGSGTTGNVVEGNVIGSDLYWSQVGPNKNHGVSIYDGASGNWIGWFNTILASGWSGVAVVNSDNNVVWLNYIGTDGADINWGNSFYGVHVVNSSNTQIFGNGIHNNGSHANEAGVRIQGSGSINNFISINSIHNNGGLGIELADGGNSSQPAPTITSGSCSGPITGTACPGCVVEIFSDTDNEGKILEESVTADPSTGAFSWSGSPAGPNMTATASSAVLGSTSQFSAPYYIGVCNNPPTAAFTYTPTKVNTCNPVAFDASSSSDVEDPLSALQVRWDWENDGTFDTNLSHQKTAQHSFSSPGGHTVRLEVQDTGGLTDATTHQITVEACKRTFMPLIVR